MVVLKQDRSIIENMRLFLFIFLLSWQTLSSQSAVRYIVFKTTIISPNPELNYQNLVPNKRVLVLDQNQIYERDYYLDLPSASFMLLDGKEKKEYITYMGNKLALKSELEFPNQNLIYIEKDSHRIAGQLCDKALILHDNDTLSIYYTDALGSSYCPVASVEGLALEYSQYFEGIGKVKFEAIEIMEKLPDRSILPQTASYQLIDKEEYVREQEKILKAHEQQRQQISNEMIGKKAKKFILTTIDGNKYNSVKLEGKVIVLNFWFVNCGPCRREIPVLNQLVAHYTNREDVLFFGLALDPSHELPAFLEKTPFHYQIAGDALYICDKFKVSNYPTNIVIDKKGTITSYLIGYTPDILEKLQKAIEAAL